MIDAETVSKLAPEGSKTISRVASAFCEPPVWMRIKKSPERGERQNCFAPAGALFSIFQFRGFASLTPGFWSCALPGRKIRF